MAPITQAQSHNTDAQRTTYDAGHPSHFMTRLLDLTCTRTIQRYPHLLAPPPANHYPANRLSGLPTTGVPPLDTPFTVPPFALSDFCSAAGRALRSCCTDAMGNFDLRVVG